jgi:hypothetical protein
VSELIKGVADLDRMYTEAESADRQDFAKMRSALLLIGGEHYMKRGSGFERLRQSRDIDEQVKLRITKNHLGKIARRYSNIICSSAPGVTIGPKHESELQDRKSAEINESIWQDAKEKNSWSSVVMQWSDDFTGIGEVWTKIVLDEYSGAPIGFEQAVDAFGMPVVDEMGEPVADPQKPRYAKQLRFEEVFAFNVLRSPDAQSIKDSPWFCVRKSVQRERLKRMFPDSAKHFDQGGETPFLVFDASHGYRRSESKECMVREWFIKPCPEYPLGYFYIQVPGKILKEGELPGGIFPLICERFDNIQTKCRGFSSIDPIRPNQAEINRCASAMATTQITLGDDKLVFQNGAKLSAGASLPGIRTMSTTGGAPVVIPGRSGEQYLNYMLANIKEMYELAEVDDEDLDGNMEPQTLLYRAASKKKRFQRYIARFENFLKEVCSVYLKMAKLYYDEDTFILAVGRNEAVNIAEFKNTHDQSVEIVIEAQADDVETKIGRQMVITNILQYVGNQLDKEMIGKLIRNMPYANVEDAFSDLTLDDECATNDLLALDRGQMPMMSRADPHEYLVKRAMNRMRQSDFNALDEQIQENYKAYVKEHLAMVEEAAQALQRSQSGFIPDGGALVGVDFYVQDPNNPERTRRARMPYDAVSWLAQKLEDQGSFKKLAGVMPDGAVAMAEERNDVPEATGSQAEISSAPPPSGSQL